MANGIINAGIMQSALKELIEKAAINADIDKLKEALSDIYGLEDLESLDFSGGQLSVENGCPAIKLHYRVTLTVPVHVDLQGNVLLSDEDEVEEYEAEDESEAMEEGIDEAGQEAGEQAGNF